MNDPRPWGMAWSDRGGGSTISLRAQLERTETAIAPLVQAPEALVVSASRR